MARVTVINDQPDYLGVMRDVLEALNHEGTPLRGETVSIEEIADTRPDLLIVDLRMDSGVLNDGWGVIVGARADPRLADVPIIISTADHEFLRNRAAEISALADLHPLPKPFGMQDVEELITRLLER
jgi:CheY-like chemotaxis protein